MTSSATKNLAYKVLRVFILLYLLALTVGHYFMQEYVYSGIILLVLIFYAFDNIKAFSSNHFGTLGNQLIQLCLITYLSYRNYSKYEDDKALISYSKEFNPHRHRLGIPIIPAFWQVKFKGSQDIEWGSHEKAIGHEKKFIVMNSDRRIKFETDDYKLKPQNKSERYIYVRYIYATGKHPDTLDYSFAVGDITRSITKSIADSILDAEHISKDY